MDRHLVTVEVGVERGTDQRMQADRLTLNEGRLECLNAEAVQRRRAVQHDRMLADNLFEDIPDFRTGFLNHPLGRLDGRGHAVHFQLVVNERLEQLERHLLRQTALVQFQLGTNDDHGTTGIVNALTEQVLTEAALLALQHV